MKTPARLFAGLISGFTLGAACSAAPMAPSTQHTQASPWMFMVRADAQQPRPRCPQRSVRFCRDDMDLSAVFHALNGMAAGTVWPFAAPPGERQAAEVQVALGAGTFRLAKKLSLIDWPGAAKMSSLRLSGAGDGLTRVTGTQALPPSDWRDSEVDPGRLPEGARGKVKVVDVTQLLAKFATVPPARRPSGFGEPLSPASIEVFFDGKPMTLARWPNTGWAQLDGKPPGAPANSIVIRGADAHSWKDEPNLFVGGYFMHDWAYERLPALATEGSMSSMVVAGDGPKFGQRAGQRVVVENSLSELDHPASGISIGAASACISGPQVARRL